jgi:hypothetical protein
MSTAATTRNSFLQRVIGAAACDSAIYEEVEADRAATAQAFAVVVLSSLAAGVGAVGSGRVGLSSIPTVVLAALMFWAAWALLTFEIGRRLMPARQTQADVGEVLRTLGFASAPGVLFVFAILPAAAAPVVVITTVWMLAAMVVGLRHALDYTSTGRAVMVCVVGWLLASLVAAFIGLVLTAPVQ